MGVRNNQAYRLIAMLVMLTVILTYYGTSMVLAAPEYTPPLYMDAYDFTGNTGSISEWFPWSAEETRGRILSCAARYNGRPYEEMDCTNYLARVLLDAGCCNFRGYLACDGNMQVQEYLKMFAGEIETGDPNVQRKGIAGSAPFNATGWSDADIDNWVSSNSVPGDVLLFYDQDGKNLHIGVYSGIKDGSDGHGAYMWHSDPDSGVSEKRVAHIIGALKLGKIITYMQRFRTTPINAYANMYIDKRTASGSRLAGATFSVYASLEDAMAGRNSIGRVTDDDLDGILTNYYGNDGSARISLDFDTRDNEGYYRFLYLKETFCPYLLLDGSNRVDLRSNGWGSDGEPQVSDINPEYRFFDENVYQVDLNLYNVNTASGTMSYKIRKIDGGGVWTELYNATIDNYKLSGESIRVTNQVTTDQTAGSQAGFMVESSSVSITKNTTTGLNINSTVFSLYDGNTLVAVYKYASGAWNWYTASGVKVTGRYFPIRKDVNYTLYEDFTVPQFKCIDGNTINYSVENKTSGWTRKSATRYSYTFRSEANKVYDFTATNDHNNGGIAVNKTVKDASDEAKGFRFELWNTQGTIKLANGVTDASGRVIWTTGSGGNLSVLYVPQGSYQLREIVPTDRYYGGSRASYTYFTPVGFTASSDGTYWYKNISTSTGTTVTQSVGNDRGQANIVVGKVSEDGHIADIRFNIYYGGNGAEPDWQNTACEIKTTDSDGIARFNDLPLGWYRIKEITPDGYKCYWEGEDTEYKVIHLAPSSDNQTVSVTCNNRIYVNVNIDKTDSVTGEIISGYEGSPVTFTLYEDTNANGILDEDEEDTASTIEDDDNDGRLKIEGLFSGAYLLTESQAPYGYYVYSEPYAFTVSEAKDLDIAIEQVPYTASVRVIKTDIATGEYIGGAGFTIYEDTDGNGLHSEDERQALSVSSDGSGASDAVFTEDGGTYTVRGLRPGNYVIVETSLPEGYLYTDAEGNASSEPDYVAITIESCDTCAEDFEVKLAEVFISNIAGEVNVFKTDKEGLSLEGAEFKVYKDRDLTGYIGTLSYIEDEGIYRLRKLSEGTYYLVETKAPEGYITDKTVYEFSITPESCSPFVSNFFAEEYQLDGCFVNVTPILGTTLHDETLGLESSHILSRGDQVELIDYCEVGGLNIGDSYSLTGTLMRKDTGSQLLNSEGEAYISEVSFIAQERTQIVEVPFTIDTSDLQGVSIVAFETITDGEATYEHSDIDDEGQTLTMPDMGTDASDLATGTHALAVKEDFDISDRVSYTGLEPGIEYTVTGYLINKETGARLKDLEGNDISSTVTFTPDLPDGEVDVVFEGIKIPMDVKDTVVFEYLYFEDTLICEHSDIDDEDQTLTRSSVITTARNGEDSKTMRSGRNVTLFDRVTYSGLEAGNEYEIVATLYMNDGTPVMRNGEIVTSSLTFTPENPDGVIEVPIKLNTSGMTEGDVVVIFENVYDKATAEEIEAGIQTEDVEIARHNDLNSREQSITVKNLPSTGEERQEHILIAVLIAVMGVTGACALITRGRRKEMNE